MKVFALHDNQIDQGKADAIKRALRPWVVTSDLFEQVKSICRISLALDHNVLVIQIILLDLQGNIHQQFVHSAGIERQAEAMMRSFIIMPEMIKALTKIQSQPSLIICDGKGLHNDYDFGLATHVGLLTNTPTIGIKVINGQMPLKVGQWKIDNNSSDIASAYICVTHQLPVFRVYAAHGICLRSAAKYLFAYQQVLGEHQVKLQLYQQIKRLRRYNKEQQSSSKKNNGA